MNCQLTLSSKTTTRNPVFKKQGIHVGKDQKEIKHYACNTAKEGYTWQYGSISFNSSGPISLRSLTPFSCPRSNSLCNLGTSSSFTATMTWMVTMKSVRNSSYVQAQTVGALRLKECYLSHSLVWDTLLLTVLICEISSLHTEPSLEGPGSVIDTRMNHPTVVPGLVSS